MVNDLIQCLADDGSFIYTNRAWRDAMGYTEDELRSMTLLDVLHPDSRLCCQQRFQRLLGGETLDEPDRTIALPPYRFLWITNR